MSGFDYKLYTMGNGLNLEEESVETTPEQPVAEPVIELENIDTENAEAEVAEEVVEIEDEEIVENDETNEE